MEHTELEQLKKERAILQELLQASGVDPVTGVWNKTHFTRMAGELIEVRKTDGFVLMRWDVDHFHLINEIYGTTEGDSVLHGLAQGYHTMMKGTKGAICWGYLGNDSFAGCFDQEGFDIDVIADKLNQAIQELMNFYHFTISIGLVSFSRQEADLAVACDRAQTALRSIKHSRGVHYAWFDDEFRKKESEERELVGEMMTALQSGDFIPYFQPQYTYSGGEKRVLCGAEILIRWQHPVKGLISPARFLPLFEKNGFIWEIDWFVWESTCRYIRMWMDQGYKVPRLSVNISRVDVFHEDLVKNLLSLAAGYGISPEQLGFEITASAYSEMASLKEVTDGLRSAGFRVVMDDFGDLNASLMALRDIPVDQVKLDVRFLNDTDASRMIFKNAVSMVREIGSAVIAEGVETEKQADFLRYIGCKDEQGYFFARPMPADQFEQLLERVEG